MDHLEKFSQLNSVNFKSNDIVRFWKCLVLGKKYYHLVVGLKTSKMYPEKCENGITSQMIQLPIYLPANEHTLGYVDYKSVQ